MERNVKRKVQPRQHVCAPRAQPPLLSENCAAFARFSASAPPPPPPVRRARRRHVAQRDATSGDAAQRVAVTARKTTGAFWAGGGALADPTTETRRFLRRCRGSGAKAGASRGPGESSPRVVFPSGKLETSAEGCSREGARPWGLGGSSLRPSGHLL
ncbi:uncharacterized protein FLJ37310-like [Schistocerca cancellata]|uniref:uncharacterized protein FLJ37310-like n=1 Tax=Schistocerca cancellata TaxID=274614 RepID=UPI0021185739|nr:uncharacterized protein FLJ37310-like [Schistocerca cancellata]